VKPSDLMHGDVLLYERKKNISLMVRGIRFVTGNKFTHSGFVVEVERNRYIVNQLNYRQKTHIDIYEPLPGEVIHCVRPTFAIPEQDEDELFYRRAYGYLSIMDCLINHAMGRISFGHWTYRPLLKKLFNTRTVICSTMVADALNLKKNTQWCRYYEVVEPDDYANHSENFMYVGIVDWR
jgi:hypothetical protein